MLTRDIMTARPVTADPGTTLDRAATVMRRERFRHLPVVRDGVLVGVLSDRDVQRALAAGAAAGSPVEAFVRGPAIVASPETPVEHAARLLQENKIGCLPVVAIDTHGAETLVGIVTESDVFGALMRTLGVLEPGSCLAVRLDDPTFDLLAVALVLQELDVPVLSLRTEPLPAAPADAPGVRRLRLVLRVGTINPLPLAAALRRREIEVEPPAGQALAAA